MFRVNDEKGITMIHGDFGEILPIKFTSGSILETDDVKFIIYKEKEKVLEKSFSVVNDILDFILTKQESESIDIGKYCYGIEQYRNGTLKDTLSMNRSFTVKRRIGE